MKIRNRIVNYLRGDRRGRGANSLEKEALKDAFLYEALEGLVGTQRDVMRDIEALSKRLKEKTRSRWEMRGMTWGLAVAFAVIVVGIWLCCRQVQTDGVQRQEEPVSLAENEMSEQEPAGVGDTAAVNVNEEPQRPAGSQDTVLRALPKPEPPVSSKVPKTRKSDTVVEGNRGSVPFGGYKKFYRYIQDSLRYPQDALEQGLGGETKLSFSVNKAGRPSHIRVVKWINYSCNREAIRLLCEGPAWNYIGDTTSYVVIPFHLKK